MSTLNLDDIQGFILRTYLMPSLRHFLLKVTNPTAARAVLGRVVTGDENDAPQISTASEAPPATLYRLQLGLTYPGLVALEVKDRVPNLAFKSFTAFVEGAAERAARVGDVGRHAPQNWVGGFGRGSDHVMLTLYAANPDVRDDYSVRLSALFAEGGAFKELWRRDGGALTETLNGQPVPVAKVHFGYTDGISQVPIKGGPEPALPDHQEPCESWLFVLSDEAENYYLPDPPELGRNGSFGVFKLIEQDVIGFENFLQAHKDKIDPELLAAKLMGRWRNGTPLVLSPDTDSSAEGIKFDQMNDFGYVNPDGSGDPKGLRCPIGAHIRRVNPRDQPVTGQGRPGGSNNSHRLVRRGIPYGPTYVPGQPDDGIERGLLGYFIGSHIENQYEFVLKQWVNDAGFVGAVRLNPKSKDVIIGNNDPAESVFEIRQSGGAPPLKITGFSSFLTTKAAAYCFLPSITALKFIASLK
jgi:deferrochelatase/peroxidase EfeB